VLLVSEKLAGLPPSAEPSVLLVSEKLAGLPPSAEPSVLLVSEKLAGLRPGPPVAEPVLSTGPGFDWGDAGIGAGVTFASMLSAAAAALTIRRRRGSLAH
jgi:hypothetical protein